MYLHEAAKRSRLERIVRRHLLRIYVMNAPTRPMRIDKAARAVAMEALPVSRNAISQIAQIIEIDFNQARAERQPEISWGSCFAIVLTCGLIHFHVPPNAELSRTDLRRCGSENVQHLHDAAKRCRLERHVMQRRKSAKQHG